LPHVGDLDVVRLRK